MCAPQKRAAREPGAPKKGCEGGRGSVVPPPPLVLSGHAASLPPY